MKPTTSLDVKEFILIDEEKKMFHLRGKNTSYVMQVLEGGYLAHLYWGKRVTAYRQSNRIIYMDRGFSPNPPNKDSTFSLDTIPQEYPGYGNGDFRTPAYQVEDVNGHRLCDLRYKDYRVTQGKQNLEGLPATYESAPGDVWTLQIMMEDVHLGLEVELNYAIFPELDVITRSARFINNGENNIQLARGLSMSLDFREADFEMITLYGAHNNEKNLARRKVVSGTQLVESTRGASSAHQSPFLALTRKETNEETGEVYGFNLVYSGNFTAEVQVSPYDTTRVSMGINPFDFSWLLEKGETFQTPEAILVYTDEGLGGMSRRLHHLHRYNLMRGKFQHKLRPILINNWEATYFDFNEEKILTLAEEARDAGIELFVLDDGWFGKRNDITSSLGDWFVDEQKLPNGLHHLANRIVKMGMAFGIWFEPEMISLNSELYRQHPEWCIQVPGRPMTIGRHQFVLDLSRPEVQEYLFSSISAILENNPITYVKWDMNRNMTDIGSCSLPKERQKEVSHRYILGLYQLLEKLTARFPNVLFEGCSSGGGRYDSGMLYYMPQTWASDNTDAICRTNIQYGTSLIFPSITMGAHVSAAPNHQVGRYTSLETRGNVAMAGNLGYELDLTKSTAEEKKIIKEQIKRYKEIRETVQKGTLYRIFSPFEGNEAAWNHVSKDLKTVVAAYVKVLSLPAAPIRTLKLKGLDPHALYRERESGEIYGGDELMYAGLSILRIKEDFWSKQWLFDKIERKDG